MLIFMALHAWQRYYQVQRYGCYCNAALHCVCLTITVNETGGKSHSHGGQINCIHPYGGYYPPQLHSGKFHQEQSTLRVWENLINVPSQGGLFMVDFSTVKLGMGNEGSLRKRAGNNRFKSIRWANRFSRANQIKFPWSSICLSVCNAIASSVCLLVTKRALIALYYISSNSLLT